MRKREREREREREKERYGERGEWCLITVPIYTMTHSRHTKSIEVN